MVKKKLAIITTHPIQYNAPWFRLLNQSDTVQPKVFYTWSQTELEDKFDPGFGKVVQWDIPLLEGYEYCFVQNISITPGTHHFKGIINPTLISEIEEWQPDAVLVFGWAFQSHLKCIRYFNKKKPVLFRGDSTVLDDIPGLKSYFRKIFLRWVYSHIDYALYVGTNNKNYFLNNGVAQKKMWYTPHAVDNERFENEVSGFSREALKLRDDLGFKNDDVVLLFAGKFEKKKNPFLLIDIARKIPDEKLKIVFVGNGKLEPELKKAAWNDKRITFMGFQNQQMMPVIYRMADLFILPSHGPGETWGLALNEAMACGKPIMATDKAGGAVDLISEQVNGLIIKKNNTALLENLLNSALADKKILETMGEQSKIIIQQFSFKKIISSVTSLVSSF